MKSRSENPLQGVNRIYDECLPIALESRIYKEDLTAIGIFIDQYRRGCDTNLRSIYSAPKSCQVSACIVSELLKHISGMIYPRHKFD